MEPVYRGWKLAARNPEVFNENMNIDEWLESLKAYLAGKNPNAASDQVLISQVKSFLRQRHLNGLNTFLGMMSVIEANSRNRWS